MVSLFSSTVPAVNIQVRKATMGDCEALRAIEKSTLAMVRELIIKKATAKQVFPVGNQAYFLQMDPDQLVAVKPFEYLIACETLFCCLFAYDADSGQPLGFLFLQPHYLCCFEQDEHIKGLLADYFDELFIEKKVDFIDQERIIIASHSCRKHLIARFLRIDTRALSAEYNVLEKLFLAIPGFYPQIERVSYLVSAAPENIAREYLYFESLERTLFLNYALSHTQHYGCPIFQNMLIRLWECKNATIEFDYRRFQDFRAALSPMRADAATMTEPPRERVSRPVAAAPVPYGYSLSQFSLFQNPGNLNAGALFQSHQPAR